MGRSATDTQRIIQSCSTKTFFSKALPKDHTPPPTTPEDTVLLEDGIGSGLAWDAVSTPTDARAQPLGPAELMEES